MNNIMSNRDELFCHAIYALNKAQRLKEPVDPVCHQDPRGACARCSAYADQGLIQQMGDTNSIDEFSIISVGESTRRIIFRNGVVRRDLTSGRFKMPDSR